MSRPAIPRLVSDLSRSESMWLTPKLLQPPRVESRETRLALQHGDYAIARQLAAVVEIERDKGGGGGQALDAGICDQGAASQDDCDELLDQRRLEDDLEVVILHKGFAARQVEGPQL